MLLSKVETACVKCQDWLFCGMLAVIGNKADMWLSTKKDHHSEYNKFLTNELHTILSIGWSQAYGTRQYDGKATEKIRMHVRCLRVIKKSIQCYITLLHYIGANDRFHVFPAAFQKVLAGHWMAFQ